MFKVIGIAGPARCGKDTAAKIMQHHNPGWTVRSFADPIKDMLRAGLGLTEGQLYGDNKDEHDAFYGCSPRHMLQTLGTEWGRNIIGRNLWVDAMHKSLENLTEKDDGIFILPDVRFYSEAKFIREHGVMVHITGCDHIIKSNHESEIPVEIEEGDFTIKNIGGLHDFRCQTLLTLHAIKEALR